ncbi:MAG: hypothetical protein QM664_10450 [Flavihumibacter sp.]
MLSLLLYWLLLACSKSSTPNPPPVDSTATENPVVPVSDPSAAATVGFFGDTWSAKNFQVPDYEEISAEVIPASATVTIDASSVIGKLPSTIFGHNAVTWMGNDINKPVVVDPVKLLQPNVLRFPPAAAVICISLTGMKMNCPTMCRRC